MDVAEGGFYVSVWGEGEAMLLGLGSRVVRVWARQFTNQSRHPRHHTKHEPRHPIKDAAAQNNCRGDRI